MKKVICLFLMLLSVNFIATGQDSKSKSLKLHPSHVIALRDFLKLSDTIQISAADASSLPDGVPLKLYLAVGPSSKLQDAILKRLNQWNEKEGKKQGTLEIVSQMNEADMVLVQISRPYGANITPENRTISERAGVPGAPYWPSELGFPPQMNGPDTWITAYIVAQSPGELKVIEKVSYSDVSQEPKHVKDGQILCDEFFKLLKKRKNGTH